MKKGPEGPFTTRLSRRASFYEVGVSMEWIVRARVRAQMNASRPEADSEYSRGHRVRTGVLAAGLLGVALLLAAEFTPLLHVHAGAHVHLARTVTAGSNHSYALLPVAALSAGLALTAWRSGSRLALLALGVLGLLTIGIALLGDLPDAHSTGLVGSLATGLSTATSRPAIGLFLETMGGIVLLLGAAAGVLLEPVPDVAPHVPRDGSAPRTRSAS
jgi:hypothetical protein